MQNQSFRFISNSGQSAKGGGTLGGILAAISSIVIVAASIVIGGFLLFIGLIVAIGLVIAFFIWKFFFFNKTKKKAEEFMRKQAEMYGHPAGSGQTTGSSSGTTSNSGTVIDGDFEDVSSKRS